MGEDLRRRSSDRGLNGLSPWVKAIAAVGIPGILVFFLLGAFARLGFPSPILDSIGAIERHDAQTNAKLRLICKGLWKESPTMQSECER